MERKLGFSTGVFGKSIMGLLERIRILRGAGCRSIELCYVNLADFESSALDTLRAADLHGFEYVSLHAPKFEYGKNEGTKKIFGKILRLERRPDLVVIHPDTIIKGEENVFVSPGFNV